MAYIVSVRSQPLFYHCFPIYNLLFILCLLSKLSYVLQLAEVWLWSTYWRLLLFVFILLELIGCFLDCTFLLLTKFGKSSPVTSSDWLFFFFLSLFSFSLSRTTVTFCLTSKCYSTGLQSSAHLYLVNFCSVLQI